MILIADSGSTKTDWALIGPSDRLTVTTQGINPVHQQTADIRQILCTELWPQLAECQESVGSVYFYGSGVRPEQEARMVALLQETFPHANAVEAHSDMLGAARALCGHNSGIASILGTGANSCLYDGEHIVKNTPALGYILGDEGSGAVLGKRFLHHLYGGLLSEEIKADFESDTGLTLPDVIQRVYRQPLPNRFLASLSTFIHQHLDDAAIDALVRQNFRDFISIHIAPYGHRELPLSFTGSIAHYYRDQLVAVAAAEGYTVGTILRAPIQGLVDYHCPSSRSKTQVRS